VNRAESIQPVTSSNNVIGALTCQVKVNNFLAECVLDTGSGLSLISSRFVEKYNIKKLKWDGPIVTVVTGDTFRIPYASHVNIEILGLELKGSCGIIDDFPHDLLLGVDFLRKTPFLLDFKNFILINPESNVLLTTPVYVMKRSICCSDPGSIIFPEEKNFETGQILRNDRHNGLTCSNEETASSKGVGKIDIIVDGDYASFIKILDEINTGGNEKLLANLDVSRITNTLSKKSSRFDRSLAETDSNGEFAKDVG
jgi:predicted aspartyl protease